MKKAPLLKVSVTILPEAEEAVMELLAATFGEASLIYHDAESGETTASVYLPKAAAWNASQRRVLSEGLKHLRACGLDTGAARISTQKIRREDWAESWKRHFKAFEIGTALLIKPSWIKRQPKRGQSVVILDPGLSFGTGQHPTTRFCLKQLVAVRKPDTGQSFLDMGTGSGILAISAAKLGYQPVEAFDFDPESVRVARINARQNRVTRRLQLTRQDLTRLPVRSAQRYDVVCANLIYDLLLAEQKRIASRVKPDGTLVLAGILQTQFPLVQRAYEKAGWKLIARRAENEWESGAFVRA